MTTHPALTSPKIGQLRDDFLQSEAGKGLSAEDAARLRKFVTWCGISTSAEAVPPFKIEEFLAAQMNTSAPARLYMPVLKQFFGYAHKRGAIPVDPMKTARLPRGAGSTSRKTPGPSPAAAAATATRVAPAHDADVVYVTRDHRDAMQADLERLRTDERQRISQMLHEAIKDGDLSENAAYDDAKMRQGLLEARIRELETKLRNVELIEDQHTNGGVGVGSRVTLEDVELGDRLDFLVVGPEETNPRGGKISHRSPVGLALMGKVPGDAVEVATPGGSVKYRILSVE